jgi:hypothetical protein
MRLSTWLRLPSPALTVSVVALVVATTGTSYAAGLIGSAGIRDNSIKTQDVKNGTLLSKDVKDNVLKSQDIRNGSLLKRDFRAGQLPAGARGPAGPTGPAGPAGPAGAGRWLLVNAAGEIEAQSGGFSVTAAYPTLAPTATDTTGQRANGNVYINANEPLGNNGILTTVALQNTVDQNSDAVTNGRAAGADSNPEFSGEIATSQCGTAGTACAPPGTGNVNHLVVSPRLSDGSVTTNDARKRFYVILTGDSRDFVAP